MRVGLLTYHWVPNYGAQLQTFSTYCVLKNRGYSPIIINWVPSDTFAYYKSIVTEKQLDCHNRFIHSHCELTRQFSDIKEIDEIISSAGITHIVIGSDSLFNIIHRSFNIRTFSYYNPTIDHSFPNPFWGEGINLPHAALSVSSQNAAYNKFVDSKDKISERLLSFSYISVRDTWTSEMVSYFTDGVLSPKVTPDPVFCFNSSTNEQYAPTNFHSKYNLPEKYALFCFNNGRMTAPRRWLNEIVTLFHKEGVLCVSLPKSTGGQKLNLDLEIPMPIDPLDWYNIIKGAYAYIGILMHPIIVCLHNAVPFFSFDHYGTGPLMFTKAESSKIFHILKEANLLDYHYLLRNHLLFPSAKTVFRLIQEFPKEETLLFSEKQESRFYSAFDELMMKLSR